MRRARNAFLAVLFALFLPFAAACGGDDNDDQGTPQDDPSETEGNIDADDSVGQTEGEGENLGGEAGD
jgi:hypothetical protein